MGQERPMREVIWRFGLFEYHSVTLELLREGVKIRLQDQPARLLSILIEHSGEPVGREDLKAKLWPADTFVEFDASLNTSIKKIRQALGDSAENPRFIETLPRQGYRFIAPVMEVQSVPEVVRPASPPAGELPAGRPIARRRWLIAAVGCAIVAGLAAARLMRNVPTGSDATRLAISLAPGQTLQRYVGRSVAISNDGRMIAYVAQQTGGGSQVFYRRLDEYESHPLSGTEQAMYPMFSPDGNSIAVYQDGHLRRIDRNGPIRDLADLPPGFSSWSGVWAGDGYIYFNAPLRGVPSAERWPSVVWRVRVVNAGKPEQVTGPGPNDRRITWHFAQGLLPGNRQLLFSTSDSPNGRDLRMVDLRTHREQTIVEHAMGGWYLPTGQLVWYWRGGLIAANFDIERSALAGPPSAVEPGVASEGWGGPNAAISSNGTLVYVAAGRGLADRTLVWVDQHGVETPVGLPPGPYEPLDIAPDDNRLLLTRFDAADQTWSLWVYNLAARTWSRVSEGAGGRINATWALGGNEVIYGSDHDGRAFHNLIRRSLAGSAEAPLTRADYGQYPQSWSERANTVLFCEGVHPDTSSDIISLTLGNNSTPSPFVKGPLPECHPTFSPDGQWVAYSVRGTSSQEVYVSRFPGPGAAIRVSGSGAAPLWAPDGRTVYYRSGGAVMAVDFTGGPTPLAGTPRRLFSGTYLQPGFWFRNFLISRDGRRFLLTREEREPDIRQINVVLNWTSELTRLAPRR
jgi:DNA-binding winged helix-turn-helix (wHTH) protein/Tol biopolymer transport system component